jgi:hypothetical protein
MPRFSLAIALLVFASATPAAPPDFDKQVAPLLAARCLDCHSGATPKGRFDISRKANVKADEVWKRVAADEMPPKKPLPEAERKLLKDWIDAGAKWGTDPIDPFRFTTSTRAGYDWWSLQPIKKPTPPVSREPQASAQPIDAFVIAKLSDKGLSLGPPADRRTLIRRVYFDLIGLPPSPEEVEAFLADKSPDAYEKVVDKLLASPHYGERWARHWLDVVRYGETDGFERNTPRPNSWHYRDWVIRAFNADMPFDEFARLQLAGDILKPNDPDAVQATGFLVAGVHNTVLGNEQMVRVARQDELEDLVGSVAQTFLGITANCARCHDHKFDPISQMDFYRLAAALGGVYPGERAIPSAKDSGEMARLAKQRESLEKQLAAIEEPARKAALAKKGKMPPGAVAAPSPVAAWDFCKGAEDLIGKLHAKETGKVEHTPDGAKFDGKTGFFRTPEIPFNLKTKTLEAWVRLDNLTQRGGGVISVETPGGNEFDAIVFGEREPGRWMAGSNGFVRTNSFTGTEEKDALAQPVHFAIAYAADGTITGYRNGKLYGRGYSSKGPLTFAAGKAVVIFGCRHEPVGGNKMLAGTVSVARLYDTALSPEQVQASFAAGSTFVSDAEIDTDLSPEQRTTRAALRKTLGEVSAELNRLTQRAANVKAYANVPDNPGITRFLARGDLALPGAVVAPAGLAAVTGPKADFGLAPDASDAERRRKLAEWITAANNPLFSRVIVNRVWHYHFGTGIVETPSDLGFNGGRPSHPELLDWLASELANPENLRDGRPWGLKSLHKLIVTSATYRQSSPSRKEALETDADDRLLWRFKPHRLEGESVRDAMLAVSGLLNREVGGKGFSDYQVRDFNGTAFFDPFDPSGPEFQRRSIYRFTPRGANRGLLDAFDCPDPAAAAPRRAVTTTPLQALTLWNNGFALRMSDAFAARVAKEADGIEKQVQRAWQLAYQRNPTAEEAKLAAKLVTDHGLKALCRTLFNSNEFVTVE